MHHWFLQYHQEDFESENVEPNDAELPPRVPSSTTGSSRSLSDQGPKKTNNKALPSLNQLGLKTQVLLPQKLTPAEQARSLILTTIDPTTNEVVRERESYS